jgi:aldose 1-epimerase
MPPSLTSRNFGSLPQGEGVEAWTLSGSGGLVLEAITYGGAMTRVMVPDRAGNPGNVVLGFDCLNPYVRNRAYIGAIVGRVAGRITGGRFELEDKTYSLACNDGLNHLHGGIEGFDKKIWTALPVKSINGDPSLRLTYRSRDGEEGYPGNVDVSVTYTVTDRNALLVEIEAESDSSTPFCPTVHHYFNLAGEDTGSIIDHELQIDSDVFILTDEQMTLTGQVRSVAGRGNDFRRPRVLGDAIPLLFQHHGDLYPVKQTACRGRDLKPVLAARLVHPASGRVLEVSTTETHLQFYTGVGLDGSLTGTSGKCYGQYAGVCLECHGYPDVSHLRNIGETILNPGLPYRQITEYAFSTLQ